MHITIFAGNNFRFLQIWSKYEIEIEIEKDVNIEQI